MLPPVCRIIDYNKFLYEKKKKEKEMKAKAHKSEVKEIRFTPNTDDHDFDFKAKHAEKFLRDGNKVKTYVQFKGRAIMFKERGELILLKFAERLAEVGGLEGMPTMEGKRMIAIFAPKTAKKKEGSAKEGKEPREPREPREGGAPREPREPRGEGGGAPREQREGGNREQQAPPPPPQGTGNSRPIVEVKQQENK